MGLHHESVLVVCFMKCVVACNNYCMYLPLIYRMHAKCVGFACSSVYLASDWYSICKSIIFLQSSLEGRISKLQQTLDRVGSTTDSMRQLLAQLEGWRDKLEKHEPPRVLPADMEKQIAEFSVSICV